MKKLREIVFKTLVNNLGVSPSLLSRIEGDEPIGIELVGGEEIYIYIQSESLQTFVEIPLKDKRVLTMKAAGLMDILTQNEQMFMNVKDNKMIVVSELAINTNNLEKELAEKLKVFNKIIHEIKPS